LLIVGLHRRPKNYVECLQLVSFAIKGLETALHITTFCI